VIWFDPTVRVTDCRDPKDDKYLALALASGAEKSSAAMMICSCCIRGGLGRRNALRFSALRR
jgi:hypothetical protein